MGFEIGNHTWSHPDLRKLSPEAAAAEIDRCNDFLAEAGIPAPVSFAYPGGPFAENVVPLLKERKLRFARTTERLPWEKAADPCRLPAYPISGNDRLGFYHAVSRCTEENAVILVFHGIPDVVHPWCDNTPECFREFLDYLADGGFRVLSLADFGTQTTRSST